MLAGGVEGGKEVNQYDKEGRHEIERQRGELVEKEVFEKNITRTKHSSYHKMKSEK